MTTGTPPGADDGVWKSVGTFPSKRHVNDLRLGWRSANPGQHKLRRDATEHAVPPQYSQLIPFCSPGRPNLVFLSSHISNALDPLAFADFSTPSAIRLRLDLSLFRGARSPVSTLLSIDDAGCAVNTTEQRRIIPCSQISEPRLRFRPRGRRYARSRLPYTLVRRTEEPPDPCSAY